jgi:hypothetical protein
MVNSTGACFEQMLIVEFYDLSVYEGHVFRIVDLQEVMLYHNISYCNCACK